jgi:hypothetical protein
MFDYWNTGKLVIARKLLNFGGRIGGIVGSESRI